MTEWQPIETVPPPLATPIMVIWAYPDGSEYDGPEEAQFLSADSYMGMTSNLRRRDGRSNWPTHWAHRPPPPRA